jgi:hypothetical protein
MTALGGKLIVLTGCYRPEAAHRDQKRLTTTRRSRTLFCSLFLTRLPYVIRNRSAA